VFNALARPLISHFAYSTNQGQTFIVYGMDYQSHIEDVFLPALSLFFNGLTSFQGHNGKLKIPSFHDNYLQKWTISFSEINLLQLLSFYWLTTLSRCTKKKKVELPSSQKSNVVEFQNLCKPIRISCSPRCGKFIVLSQILQYQNEGNNNTLGYDYRTCNLFG